MKPGRTFRPAFNGAVAGLFADGAALKLHELSRRARRKPTRQMQEIMLPAKSAVGDHLGCKDPLSPGATILGTR